MHGSSTEHQRVLVPWRREESLQAAVSVILRAANLTVARHNNLIGAQHENLIIVQHDNLLAAGKAGRISWSGNFTWNPDANEQDREHRNALAASGYWLAFQAVQKSLRTPNSEAVRDAMPVFFEMPTQEAEPSVRIMLGHFIFVHIHPYMDGNGRIGRFLMNVLLAAGGYPWTVVPLERRDAYMAALEEASVRQNIAPFADFLAKLVKQGLRGKPVAKVPAS
jgi:hypothetical protein